jgi:hypothetical protein
METLTKTPTSYLVNLFSNHFEKASTQWELVFLPSDSDVLCESSVANDCSPHYVTNDCACK